MPRKFTLFLRKARQLQKSAASPHICRNLLSPLNLIAQDGDLSNRGLLECL